MNEEKEFFDAVLAAVEPLIELYEEGSGACSGRADEVGRKLKEIACLISKNG